MKKSEILHMARGMIERKSRNTVCQALDCVRILVPGAHNQINELKVWIRIILEGHVYYEDWLEDCRQDFLNKNNLSVFTSPSKQFYAFDVVRPGRLAWMDWMIQIHVQAEAEEEAKSSKWTAVPTQQVPGLPF